MGSMAIASDDPSQAVGQDATDAIQSPGIREEDRPIVQAFDRGDLGTAMRLCVESHATAIGRLCMALVGCQAEAEELTQETLLSAQTSLGSFRRDGALRSWLFAIARRKCARHLERRTKRSERELEPPSEGTPPSDELLAARHRAERVRKALDDIRPTEREAVVLRYVCELDYRDVADACGIEEPAARKRVSRALARLRETLGNEE